MKLVPTQMNSFYALRSIFEHEVSDILTLLLNRHNHCNIFPTYTQLAHQTYNLVPEYLHVLICIWTIILTYKL